MDGFELENRQVGEHIIVRVKELVVEDVALLAWMKIDQISTFLQGAGRSEVGGP